MSDNQTNQMSDEEVVKKYKTVARAVGADDVQAARVLHKILLDQGKALSKDDVSSLGFLWLTKPRKGGRNPEMVDFLHELGFNFKQFVPNAGTRSQSGNHIPFLLLEDKDGPAILERALDVGAIPLESRDTRGDTLLMDALDLGLFDLADKLLARGLSPDLRNLGGHTALHLFAHKVNFSAVDWLLKNGADPDINDYQYARPSQHVPESVGGGWDTDCLYDALEDYVDDFKAGKPFLGNPQYQQMLEREKREAAEAEEEVNAAPRSPGP